MLGEAELDQLDLRLRAQGPALFHEARRAISELRGRIWVLESMKDVLIEDKLSGGKKIRTEDGGRNDG